MYFLQLVQQGRDKLVERLLRLLDPSVRLLQALALLACPNIRAKGSELSVR